MGQEKGSPYSQRNSCSRCSFLSWFEGTFADYVETLYHSRINSVWGNQSSTHTQQCHLSADLKMKTDLSSSKDLPTLREHYGTCPMPAPPPRTSSTWKKNVPAIVWAHTKYFAFVIYLETLLGHSLMKRTLFKVKNDFLK